MNCDQRALHLSNFLAWWWEWERIVENPCGYFEPQCARVMSTQMGVTVHTEKEVIRSHCTWSFKLRYKVLCDLIVASWVCVCVCVSLFLINLWSLHLNMNIHLNVSIVIIERQGYVGHLAMLFKYSNQFILIERRNNNKTKSKTKNIWKNEHELSDLLRNDRSSIYQQIITKCWFHFRNGM